MAFECVLKAWEDHQSELRQYLVSRLPDPAMADDFLQDVFFRAMRAGQTFCELDNPRAWLFRVARNALTDNIRLRKQWVPVPDHLPDERWDDREPVDELDRCIHRTLPVLADADRDILQACDLGVCLRWRMLRRTACRYRLPRPEFAGPGSGSGQPSPAAAT